MNYKETLDYLFVKTPMFSQVGAAAYKEGLDTTMALAKAYEEPYKTYKTVHVAGTNGKGSTTHSIASVLQESGYKTGLYTSPHLKDFSERIRVNGKPIEQKYVVDFVEGAKDLIESLKPSFFEITTIMAFKYFKDMGVDVAVIETGLGGRLDSTNIITPLVSIITNVSFDHIKQLGNTLEAIAGEKAGIIKPGVPAVVGEAPSNLRPIYESKGSPIVWAEDMEFPDVEFELKGLCQEKNLKTILAALEVLKLDLNITDNAIAKGLANVIENTGLMGRWQTIGNEPLIIADTAHNEGGIRYIAEHLQKMMKSESPKFTNLRIVFGMVKDKDISAVLALLPKDAVYYFCNAATQRSLPAQELQALASGYGLKGNCYPSVPEAYKTAKAESSETDLIYIGGSNFVVAEVL